MQKAWVGEMSDTRVAELEALAIEECLRLPMAADLIAFFERHGYIVDLVSGEVCSGISVALMPSAQALCHLYGVGDEEISVIFAPVVEDDSQLQLDLFDYEAEAQDYEADIADRAFWARGEW